jgi:hypothetical protein
MRNPPAIRECSLRQILPAKNKGAEMKTVLAATALLLTSIGAANAQDLDQQMQNFDRGMMGPPSVDRRMQNFDQRMMEPPSVDRRMQNVDQRMMRAPVVDQQMQSFDQRMMGPGGNNLIIMPNGRAW